MPSLSLSVLGPFEANLDDRPLGRFRTRITQALLIYLACQPDQAHQREHLMALLWPGLPQKSVQANLRQTLYLLRKAIPELDASDGLGAVPFLIADRQTIQINPRASYDLDVTILERLLAGPIESWPEAIALYQGDFLADFYLPDSASFEEWVSARREALRRRILEALEKLAGRAMETADYEMALGYARRQVEIDDLHESGHRQLMVALTRLDQRNEALSHFDSYRRLIKRELDAELTMEMLSLYQQILAGDVGAGLEGGRRPLPETDHRPAVIADRLSPTVLDESFPIQSADPPRPLFVGRQAELAYLMTFFESALNGESRVAFVAGDAGSGKSSLLSAFAKQASEAHDGLLVAPGACNAFSGQGDPYLPFRDILSALTGEVENAWSAGTISTKQARAIWRAMPAAIQALLDHGPDLLDTLMPKTSLLARAEKAFPAGHPLLERLKQQMVKAPASGEMEQSQIFEQATTVLRHLSTRQPIVITLDDLQWADSGSIALLFQLGRRLAGARILLIGAYRPEEVMGQASHPLRPLLDEFRRTYGDVWLDLNQTQGRDFVDAYLDSEANRLGEKFRQSLFGRTGGHPLFTVELLRHLQTHGHLTQEDNGAWTTGPDLDWEVLPARVEGVIAARIDRLEEEQREILTVASVEGEEFTVQVVAQVLELDERGLLRTFSRSLEKRYQLVHERAPIRLGRRLLSRYRFAHALFQQYLYDELGLVERQLLHGEIAAALEEIYAGRTNEIAVQLARHWLEAGEGGKALPYLMQAGDEARDLYAFEDATRVYEQALAILKDQGDFEGASRISMKLGLTYHGAFKYELARMAFDEGFALYEVEWTHLPGSSLPRAPHPLRIIGHLAPPTLDPTRTIEGEIIPDIFSGLVRYSPALDLLPDVADHWKIEDGGRTYIFHLRDDVYWSDGQPVTAGDFVYAWQRALDPIHGSPSAIILYDIKGATARHQGRDPDPEHLGVSAPDFRTFRVELEQPSSYFLQVLAHGVAMPVPQHVIQAHGDTWTEINKIVSNGRFLAESWQADDSLVLGRNPTYHRLFRGNVEKVVLLFARDTETALELYAADELDVLSIWRFSPAKLRRVMKLYADNYLNLPAGGTGFVGFSANQPPFDDPRVRRAFVLATDRQFLVDEHELGRAFPATGGLVPPGVPGHVPGIALPHDAAGARQLLSEVGYPEGRGLPHLKALLHPGDEVRLPEYIFEPWESSLGVKISWELVEWNEYKKRITDERPHLFAYGWESVYRDPDGFLRMGMQQISDWRDDAYYNLVDKARRLMDHQERMRLYRQAEEILVEQAPIMPVLYLRTNWLVKPWVRNYPRRDEIPFWHWFDNIVIDPH